MKSSRTGKSGAALRVICKASFHSSRFVVASALLAAAFAGISAGCEVDDTLELESLGTIQAQLTKEQRMARYAGIKQAAVARGLKSTGYLLAGIAYAETGLAHCWSEATWACKGPNSPDCGGGPVIAGSADGPCSDQQGGLGMFQFDAGTYSQTLAAYGEKILTVVGNTDQAITFVTNMVKNSMYISGIDTDAQALSWLTNYDYHNATLRDLWIKTVVRHYNGCKEGWSCWSPRYKSYNESLSAVISDTGLPYWESCQPQPETCNGKDDDCDGEIDEDQVCENEVVLQASQWMAQALTTDINGDGKADVCGRGAAGVWCHLSSGTSFGGMTAITPLSDAKGWSEDRFWSTLRMADIDGDQKADLCARSSTRIECWKSDGNALTQHVDGPAWADSSGWNNIQYYSTIRMLDIDGDGKHDVCARASSGIVCHKSTGAGFGASIAGPPWSDASGFNKPQFFGTLQAGDVNGDGKDDLCIRTASGMDCRLSDGNGFPTQVKGPDWSDAQGWAQIRFWSTIKLADFNGDGKDDLCARGSAGIHCHFSTGTAFDEGRIIAPLSDASGWNDPSNYLTFRVGDIDGNGSMDLCARANAGMLCYVWDGSTFNQITGPALSDTAGWNLPSSFNPILLGDVNGDKKADICSRSKDGWTCYPSTGTGFGAAISLNEFSDAGGWTAPRYYGTLQFGSPRCVPKSEVCNGKDDNCNGLVDEGNVCDNGGSGGSSGVGGSGGSSNAGGEQYPNDDTSTGGRSSRDASTKPETSWGEDEDDSAGCACRYASRANHQSAWLTTVGLLLLGVYCRSHRRANRRYVEQDAN